MSFLNSVSRNFFVSTESNCTGLNTKCFQRLTTWSQDWFDQGVQILLSISMVSEVATVLQMNHHHCPLLPQLLVNFTTLLVSHIGCMVDFSGKQEFMNSSKLLYFPVILNSSEAVHGCTRVYMGVHELTRAYISIWVSKLSLSVFMI